jgi:signal peptidase II
LQRLLNSAISYLSLIIGGALGNLIDRIRLNYVIDYFDFTLINYPIFNVADVFVVCGTILLAYGILFRKNMI